MCVFVWECVSGEKESESGPPIQWQSRSSSFSLSLSSSRVSLCSFSSSFLASCLFICISAWAAGLSPRMRVWLSECVYERDDSTSGCVCCFSASSIVIQFFFLLLLVLLVFCLPPPPNTFAFAFLFFSAAHMCVFVVLGLLLASVCVRVCVRVPLAFRLWTSSSLGTLSHCRLLSTCLLICLFCLHFALSCLLLGVFLAHLTTRHLRPSYIFPIFRGIIFLVVWLFVLLLCRTRLNFSTCSFFSFFRCRQNKME